MAAAHVKLFDKYSTPAGLFLDILGFNSHDLK